MASDGQRDAVRDGINTAADTCIDAFHRLKDRIRCDDGCLGATGSLVVCGS